MNNPAAQPLSSPSPLGALPARIRRGQGGTVLVVSLIILLLMTLIGITAMNTTSLEEKMAGNSRDRNFAFQAAESALREAENNVQTLCTTAFSCPGLTITPLDSLDFTTMTNANWVTNGREYGTAAKDIAGVAADPRYIIELLQDVPDNRVLGKTFSGGKYYRITARGTGSSDGATVILQATVVRRF